MLKKREYNSNIQKLLTNNNLNPNDIQDLIIFFEKHKKESIAIRSKRNYRMLTKNNKIIKILNAINKTAILTFLFAVLPITILTKNPSLITFISSILFVCSLTSEIIIRHILPYIISKNEIENALFTLQQQYELNKAKELQQNAEKEEYEVLSTITLQNLPPEPSKLETKITKCIADLDSLAYPEANNDRINLRKIQRIILLMENREIEISFLDYINLLDELVQIEERIKCNQVERFQKEPKKEENLSLKLVFTEN